MRLFRSRVSRCVCAALFGFVSLMISVFCPLVQTNKQTNKQTNIVSRSKCLASSKKTILLLEYSEFTLHPSALQMSIFLNIRFFFSLFVVVVVVVVVSSAAKKKKV